MQATTIHKPTLTRRGGAGRGQGRKPLNGEAKTVRITITLTEGDLTLLDKLSPYAANAAGVRERNRSEGVRWALRALQQDNKALLAEVQRIKAATAADPTLTVTEEQLEREIAAKVAAMNKGESPGYVEN